MVPFILSVSPFRWLCPYGWLGEDTTEIKTGSPASLTIGSDGKVRRINLSDRQIDQTALPMNVTAYDLEDKLTITGLV